MTSFICSLRSVHTREVAPERPSRNTLPSKHPNQYTRGTRRGSWMMEQPDWGMWTKKISQFDWPTGGTSCHGKQISVPSRKLAPEKDSCNRFAPGACSLISNQFDTREQNSGAKVLLRNIFFREKSLVQTRELCFGSVFQERAVGATFLVCTDL